MMMAGNALARSARQWPAVKLDIHDIEPARAERIAPVGASGRSERRG